jgi:peptide/nickel transport system substrate-binding protein
MPRATRRSRTLAGACLAAGLALVTACGGGGQTTGTIQPDGELRMALQFSPRSGYAMDTDDAFLLHQFGASETLVNAGSDGRPQPALATSWSRLDPATWRFELRPDVTFQDGAPLDSAAVVNALSWVTGAAAPPRAVKGLGLTAVADGPAAVRITTTKPDPILPLRMSSVNTAILSPAAYSGDAPPRILGTGTGPMRLTAADGVRQAVLERNDGYWGPKPGVRKVTATYVSDPAARALALRAGDVDIAQGLPESSLPEFTGDGGFTNSAVAAPRTVSLLMNQSAQPFADIRVRQAVEKALDRTALAEQALAGAALPASELFGPAVAWGSQDPPAAPDVEAAKALLAQAGHGPDNPLTVRLQTYPNRPELPTLATAVQGMLREIGIDAQIRIGEYATQEPDLLAGRYDLYLLSRNYLTDVPDAGATLASDYSCAGSYNLNRYCSPKFDALLAPLGTTADPAARQDAFRAASAKLTADVAGIPLVHSQENGAARNVSGYIVDPLAKDLVTPELATLR